MTDSNTKMTQKNRKFFNPFTTTKEWDPEANNELVKKDGKKDSALLR